MQSIMCRVTAISLASTLLIIGVSPAGAAMQILSCEPTWAALAEEVGGDLVDVKSATTARQDVHYIQARPSLISKLRRADLLICSGADLEIGWLPVLLRKASNARVQPGRDGNLDVSKIVPMLEVPLSVDRSQGDVHPFGNPHTETDPHNIGRVAAELSRRLQRIDPSNADAYRQRGADFARRWDAAIADWETRGASLRGMKIMTHHVAWIYLANWLGLEIVDQLEDKPGIPPNAGHLVSLLAAIGEQKPELIIRSVFEPKRPAQWLSERSGVPTAVLPHTIGATDDAKDLFSLFDDILNRLLEAHKG